MKRSISEQQLAANRANAARSTGPRTPQGKARSALNARTHGLSSAFAVLRIEESDELNRLKADAVDLYQPANNEELYAVERIAICKLAILRAARLEAGLFLVTLNLALNDDNVAPFVSLDPALEDATRDQTRNYALGEGFHRMAKTSNGWSLFLRYQSQAERQYRRAVEEFERLRSLILEPAVPSGPPSDPDSFAPSDLPIEPISEPETLETAPPAFTGSEPIAPAAGPVLVPPCGSARALHDVSVPAPMLPSE